ncbi:MAG TPA: aconitase/3-isopropylmalate dehydratase large subunit family protein [Verrucomicrobiae bacterium]|nr:aconitase/3-isopropylmalate dehydratase large subunit family protein [Verrucomicrobiae bacterium]
MIEKILARASGKKSVAPGEVVVANVDCLLLHDLSGYLTGRVFDKEVRRPMRYPERVVMIFDHHFCPPSEEGARVLEENRDFARRHGINLFDCGNGNTHHVGVQNGFIRPGTVVVGSDSHTPVHGALGCFATGLGNDSHAGTVMPFGKAWFRVPETIQIRLSGKQKAGVTPRDAALWLNATIGEGGAVYKALEFTGPYLEQLDFWDRWLFPLITVDLGAKCGYIEPDDKTISFVRGVTDRPFDVVKGDSDRKFEALWEWDISALEPQVACPPTVGNVKSVGEVEGQPVQWAELGGHGGARLEDFRLAALVLKGRRVHRDARFNLVPSSRAVFAQAIREGLVEALHAAGATWFPPSTGSNQAYNMGAMTKNEAMISTHARNFPGRNGNAEAKMFLASAATVAASAVTGRITDPRQFLK